tara:strand:- start:105 stop:1403 length:1299 start_codon:yes stop_codon:yes gene_type:complete
MLIQNNDNIILTDPWYKKPAFGSWLSIPPSIYNPVYFLALAESHLNFSIVISHGHDDHFDDDFLSLIPKHTNIFLPKFDSIGIRKRLERCGLKNIKEFDSSGINHNGIKYKSYIFKDISIDDAFITINTDDFIVAHANDNWQKLPNDVLSSVKNDFSKHKKSNRLFMSQTNMADGFPLIYENYTDDEKIKITKTRQDRMILTSIQNSIDVDCDNFISYAGLSLPFVKGNEQLIDRAHCKSLKYIKQLVKDNNMDDIVLDMIPGDSYNFDKVEKLFGKQYYDHDTIKNASIKYYKKYGWIDSCDTYDKNKNIKDWVNKEKLLGIFIDNFKIFVEKKLKKVDKFQTDIFNINFTMRDSEVIKSCKFTDNPSANVTFTFSDITLSNLLTAKINWEHTYVGYQSKIKVDSHYNINPLIRWLSMYGYVYQQKIYKKM